MRQWLSQLDHQAAEILKYCWLVCLVYLMIIVLYDISARFLSGYSIGWMDETVYLALTWMVFGEVALLFRDNNHLRVNLMDTLLGNRKKARKVYKILVNISVLVCLITFSWISFRMVLSTQRISPVLGISYKLWFVSICFSMCLSVLYVTKNLIKDILSLHSGLQ